MPDILKFIIVIIILIIIILYYVFIVLPVRAEIAEGERSRKEARKSAEFFSGTSSKTGTKDDIFDDQKHYPDSHF